MKQTAIFALPVLALYWLQRDDSRFWDLLFTPAGYLCMCMPRLLRGAGVRDAVFNAWTHSIGGITGVVQAVFTNIYSLYEPYGVWSNWVYNPLVTRTGDTLCVCFLLCWFLWLSRRKVQLDWERFLLLCVTTVVFICCFKPGIHDRYMLLADVVSVLYFLISQKREGLAICGVVNFISFYNIKNYLWGTDNSEVRLVVIQILSICFIAFTIWLLRYTTLELDGERRQKAVD